MKLKCDKIWVQSYIENVHFVRIELHIELWKTVKTVQYFVKCVINNM